MTDSDPELKAIEDALRSRGLPNAELGRWLGLDSAQVSRLFNGKRKLQRHEARIAQEKLGLAQAGVSPASGSIVAGPGMVPLYGWVGASSETRLTIADQNLRGFIPAHPSQQHVRDAFALEVNDVSMSPRYEPGEIVYLAPNRWPRPNQDGVFVTTESEGLLKRFLRRSETELLLHQLNPDKDFAMALSTIAQVHAVVGRN
jgi:phage repressor protein C with HTH and peptisase S24 domain